MGFSFLCAIRTDYLTETAESREFLNEANANERVKRIEVFPIKYKVDNLIAVEGEL